MIKQSLIDYCYTQAFDVDSDVKLYLDKIGKIEMSTYTPIAFKMPHFTNRTEQRRWEVEEIRRTRQGYGGICGMSYLYTYYWKIKSKESGLRIPEYRRGMTELFNIIESCLYGESEYYPDRTGQGLILMGRRRWGKSAGIANAMYSTAIHNPYADIGITSKDEADVKKFFAEILKIGYDNLPPFLRASSTAGNSAMRMDFSRKVSDKEGNTKREGIGSTIFGRSPTETNFEGTGMKMFVIDEIGKMSPNQLKQLWSYTEPALAADDGITRIGVPILGGTAGDMDMNGDDARHFWQKADDYGFVRYAAMGWNGLMVGPEGNENVIEGLKYILSEREKRKRQSMKRYYDFVVQYPLEEEEMFIVVGDTPFDLDLINNRNSYLFKNPTEIVNGRFREVNGNVEFYPEVEGPGQMIEHPEKGTIYAAGCDPTDGAKKANIGSDLSFFIAKGLGHSEDSISNSAVFQYTAKPKDMNEAYEQCYLACRYYSPPGSPTVTVLIERNRARMIAYFEDRQLSEFLAKRPQKVGKISRPTHTIEYGVYMDTTTQDQLIGMIDDDIMNNIEHYNFTDLLGDLATYNPDIDSKKHDRVDAWGLTLLNLRTTAKSRVFREKTDSDMYNGIGFVKNKGKLVQK